MIIVRTGTLISGNAAVTALRRTSDLATSLFVYGDGISIESAILSIDSAVKVTMTKDATATGSKNLEFTNANVGVYHERNCALIDVRNEINERGDHIQFIFRDENKITRDRYNSVQKRDKETKIDIRAYPVEFRPSTRRLEKAGLRQEADVTIWTAMKDWIDNSINFKDIDTERCSIKLQGENYEFREKALVSQFNDSYLYLTMGLFKR